MSRICVFPPSDGSVFLGDKGIITTGTYGEQTRLLPLEKMKDYKFPAPTLTRSPGHYRDWIRACKGGDPGMLQFQCCGSIRGMDAAGCDRATRRRQDRVGCGEDEDHQQSSSQQIPETDLSQRLVPHVV